MKYKAECGDEPVFKSEQACIEYERNFAKVEEVRTRVEEVSKLRDFKTDSARKRWVTDVMWWVECDVKDNPERYGVQYDDYGADSMEDYRGESHKASDADEDVDEAAVRAITGAA